MVVFGTTVVGKSTLLRNMIALAMVNDSTARCCRNTHLG